MNKFELFTMIFYALDLYYDEHQSDELGRFLSEMSPFTFVQIGSADPAVYDEFRKFIGDRKITVDNSYSLAIEYTRNIKDVDVYTPVSEVSENKWIEGCKKYLETEHKGSN